MAASRPAEEGDDVDAGVNRYLLVTTAVDESKFPPPELKPVPQTLAELDAILNPKPEEAPEKADKPDAEKTADENSESKTETKTKDETETETKSDEAEKADAPAEERLRRKLPQREEPAEQSEPTGETDSSGSGEATGKGEAQEPSDRAAALG